MSVRWEWTRQSGETKHEHVRVVGARPDPLLPACSQRSQMQSLLPAHSKSRFYATSKATSTPTSMLPVSPIPLLPAKPDPPLPACFQQSQIVRVMRVSMSEQWDQAWACQSCEQGQIHRYLHAPSEARANAYCQFIPNPHSLLPAMPHPPFQHTSSESSSSATNEASFTPNSKAGSITTSQASITQTNVGRFTTTDLLPGKPVSPLPAKTDPPLPACSQRSQIVSEVRVSMSEWWGQACQSLKSEYVRVVWASISGMKVSMSELWNWAHQSCESEHVRGVCANLSE